MQFTKKSIKFLFFACFLWVLLCYPFIDIANKNKFILGFPLLYLYTFFVWIVSVFILKKLSKEKEK